MKWSTTHTRPIPKFIYCKPNAILSQTLARSSKIHYALYNTQHQKRNNMQYTVQEKRRDTEKRGSEEHLRQYSIFSFSFKITGLLLLTTTEAIPPTIIYTEKQKNVLLWTHLLLSCIVSLCPIVRD